MHLSMRLKLLLLTAFTYATALHAQGLDTLHLRTIFYQPYLAGVRPEFSTFSANQKTLYFNWNDSAYAKKSLYETDLRGNKVSKAPANVIVSGNISPDHKTIAYARDHAIWLSDINGHDRRKIFSDSGSVQDPVWSHNNNRLAFIVNGNVWLFDRSVPSFKQITKRHGKEPGFNIVGWADHDHVLVIEQENSRRWHTYYFPQYLHKYVQPGRTRRGIENTTISRLDLANDSLTTLVHCRCWIRNQDMSYDGHYFAVDQFDTTMKHRIITVFNLQQDTSYVVFRDSTRGWMVWETTEMKFAPGSERLMFTSERTGWNHIYTVRPDGSGLKQWTHGSYEIPWVAWKDDQTFVYASTQIDPGERHLYELSLKNGKVRSLTPETAFRENFHISRNRRYVVYSKTYWNQPEDLYLLDLKNPKREIQLTHSVPKRFYKVGWQRPVYDRFISRDGHTKISMSYLKPENMVPGKKYPVIVFVHGAGSLQNVYKGWSNDYYREYMFNQLLTREGYTVMQVDYHHSTGYGRAFREKVEGWLGHYETQDIIDGIRELAKKGFADTTRVGVYGGSYGGFMALYTVSVAPQMFKAAAALRAVTNWRNYYYTNPWYTLPRLGTPEKNPENYERSSPLSYADSLKRPVLILHGLRDNNVGYQDAAQYIHALIKSGNHNFWFMMYPGERHSFTKDYDWFDEYSRIERFFNRELK